MIFTEQTVSMKIKLLSADVSIILTSTRCFSNIPKGAQATEGLDAAAGGCGLETMNFAPCALSVN